MVAPGVSAAVASRLTGRPLHDERDDGNGRVVVDDCVVVSWLEPAVPRPHPGADVLAYLAAQGFGHMPGFVGVHLDDDMVEAIVTEYVADAVDGWEWYVGDVVAWLDGGEAFDALVESARQLATITAELHTALGGLQRSTIATRTYQARSLDSLHEAMRVVDGEAGAHLRARESAVRGAIEPLRGDRMLPAHRVHGDLHVGQFLRADRRTLLQGFVGNPTLDHVERRLPHSPLRDVASLVESIDHVGRIVLLRHRPGRADVARFTDAAIAAVIDTTRCSPHGVDLELLRAPRQARSSINWCTPPRTSPHGWPCPTPRSRRCWLVERWRSAATAG